MTADECPRHGQHEDAAKRISDQYALHRIALGDDALGKWFAVALADGRSNGDLYDSRGDAVRHQGHNEARYWFVPIRPGAPLSVCDAQIVLTHHRATSRQSAALLDRDHPAGGRQLITRLTTEDQRAQIRALVSGSAPSNLIIPRGA